MNLYIVGDDTGRILAVLIDRSLSAAQNLAKSLQNATGEPTWLHHVLVNDDTAQCRQSVSQSRCAAVWWRFDSA